jgi:hypothetical protein
VRGFSPLPRAGGKAAAETVKMRGKRTGGEMREHVTFGRRRFSRGVELRAAVLLAAVGLAGATPAPDAFGRLAGSHDNAAQMRALGADVARTASPGKPWVDAQYARLVRFPRAELGELVYYMEWRAGGPAGEITRQRIWAFKDLGTDKPRMRFYVADQPGLWAAAAGDPALLQQLAKAGLPEYPPGCEVVFSRTADGWDGVIPRDACVIVARESGRRMTIDARITLERDGWKYDESGTLDDGRRAFLVPEGFRYEFRPAR